MGSRCCGPDLESYQIKLDKVEAAEAQREERKGLPSQKIAIRLIDISAKYKSDTDLQNINRMVFKVAEYEKKFKDPIRINKAVLHQNRLQQPYYIPSLHMFYVGQWVFNKALNQNVPGGIGRLFEDGVISEGVFKTFLLDAQEVTEPFLQSGRQNSSQRENAVQYLIDDEKKANTSTKKIEESKIKQLLKADQKKMANDYNFVVKLNGAGRINSVQQNTQDQILLEGDFSEGKLNGKGTLKMTTNEQETQFNDAFKKKKKKKVKASSSSSIEKISDNNLEKDKNLQLEKQKNQKIVRKTQYFYNGFWKEGVKHGKGIEKVQYLYKQKANQSEIQMISNSLKNQRKTISYQSFKYEGSFFQNSKHGKGNLTFMGSPKIEHEILRDIEKMENQMRNQGENIKSQASAKILARQARQNFIQQKLDEQTKQKFRASHIKLNKERSLLFDINFNIQRAYRTIFSENYVGDFAEGQMSGQGTYVWANGKTYRGKWKQNKLHGKGEFYWPDQTYFQGEYVDDERTGQGLMIWNLFKRYRGNWAFGMRHGYGQSIQILEKIEEMVIKGSIWDRDKVKRKLFEEIVSIKGFHALWSKQIGNEEKSILKEQIGDDLVDSNLVLSQNFSSLSNSISRK